MPRSTRSQPLSTSRPCGSCGRSPSTARITAAADRARLQPAGDEPAAAPPRGSARHARSSSGSAGASASPRRGGCSPATRAVTTALEAAAGELAEMPGLRSGRVRLAAFPSASPTIVPRLIAAMAARHPASTSVRRGRAARGRARPCATDRADLAITFSYPGDRDDPHRRERARASTSRTRTGRADAARAARRHARAASDAVDLGDARGRALDRRMPALPRPPARARATPPASRRASRSRPTTSSPSRSMVAQGLGVALLPALAIESSPGHAGVVVRPTAQRGRPHHAPRHRRGRRACPRSPSPLEVLATARRASRHRCRGRSARHRIVPCPPLRGL